MVRAPAKKKPVRPTKKKAARPAKAKAARPKPAAKPKKGAGKPAARKPAKASRSPAKRPVAPRARKPAPAASLAAARVIVENVNVPGYKTSLDAAKYTAVRDALVAALPTKAPGLTHAEMTAAVKPRLPADLAAKAMWWVKSVQLDLEAKRHLVREPSKPLRWHLS
jgi:hypothetical protein